ncbi:ArnT family glycosyltransferase [Streptomyces incarnatus]|uniref:ArnT family glycosyltransferase n=1 Tax=Streptomyces incarnatus TaxID=665007 RepID=UPI000AF67610|nr:phospholipid carrier-dependent glycosyltransferase [Streptomyces incarnatus]
MMAREQHLVLTRAAAREAPRRPAPARLRARLQRHRRWLVPLLAAVLLAQMAAAMVTTAVQQTPTIDEPVYVATATDYLHEHRIRYNPEHPPLGKLLIAAGVAVADPHYDPSYRGTQGDVGRHLLYESGNDPWRLMLWARLPVIVLTLLFGLVAFAFARDLTGTAGGLVALTLYAFSPDLIAHGSLATLDVPMAGFVLTSAWLVWRARRRPRRYLPLAGAALGAAVATKMSALPAIPVLMTLAALSALTAHRGPGLPPGDRPAPEKGRTPGRPPTGGPHKVVDRARDARPADPRPDTDTGREREAPRTGGPDTGDGLEPDTPRTGGPDTGDGAGHQAPQTDGPAPHDGGERKTDPTGGPQTGAGRKRRAPHADGPDTSDAREPGTPQTGGPYTGGGRERDARPTGGSPVSTGRARRWLSALTAPVGPRRHKAPALAAPEGAPPPMGLSPHAGRREAHSPLAGPAAARPHNARPPEGGTAGVRRRVAALSALAGAPGDRRRRVLSAVAGAVVVGVVAIAVVWAVYLAVDPRLRFSPVEPVSAAHGLRGRLVGLLPVPEAYRAGMRVQFGLEDQPWQGYLFGHLYTGSLWYYLPAALLVKTPLGLLALGGAGAVAVVAVRRLRPAAPYVLLAPGVLLAAAMTGSRDFGTRYALFVPVFLAVAAACVPRPGRRWTAAAAAALVLCTAVSSLRTFPYYLPYSNEAFGGPARTHRLLHDSNVDWGQDLGRLADRLRRLPPGERVWLVYKGSGVPSYYGIRAADPRTVPPDRVHGLLVVSDSALAKARGRLAELVGSSRPAGDVGHSISLFRH